MVHQSLTIGMGDSIYTGEGKDYPVTSLIFWGSSSYWHQRGEVTIAAKIF